MAAFLQRGGREIWLDGPQYPDVLRALHARLKPASYFEIGTLHGQTLALARCASIAVDPAFQLTCDVHAGKPSCRLFEQASDDFFATHDLTALLGAPVDLAFLDGMHAFAFLLRDFINTERACAPGSTIVLHDCLPREAAMTGGAERPEHGLARYRGYWTGDVWKMVPLLRALRPELKLTCLDAPPTGLVACTGLDPQSRVLSDAYDRVLAEWKPVRLQDYGMARLLEDADPRPADAWLDAMSPFHHPQPAWKRAVKRALGRPWRRPRRKSGSKAQLAGALRQIRRDCGCGGEVGVILDLGAGLQLADAPAVQRPGIPRMGRHNRSPSHR